MYGMGPLGYVRVSTYKQNTDRQLEGIELDRCFTDRVSGKSEKGFVNPALKHVDPKFYFNLSNILLR
jgi:DNA invertase Pin-like site-specific DNA recombinase